MSQVLYRKYRPKNLDEVYGQEHVVTTLRNQLEGDGVAHAYLFAGPRGTGKTTVARILASELGVREIDLIEVDAASNRGIDDIRSLRESVQFQPAQSPKKLYILDEAHMLTKEAFNALLKTLEEPPSHAHFVLCTTEPQRLPVTILSRCQRFNFELGDKQVVKDYLQSLLDLEGIKLEPEALNFIAEKSGGSYRDAAGLLQGVMGLQKDGGLEPESVLQRLGFGIEKEVDQLISLLLQNNAYGAVVELNKLVDKGVDTGTILDTLVEQLRSELINNKASSASNIKLTRDNLLELLRGLHEARPQVKTATPQHLPIELAILEHAAGEVEAAPVVQERKPTQTDNELPWSKIMQEVRKYNHSLEALLRDSEPQGLEDNVVRLNFKYKFHKEKIEEAGNRRLVEKAISEILGREVRIRCTQRGTAQKEGDAEPRGRKEQPTARVKDEGGAREDDILKVAQEIFGGEIIE